MKSFFMHSLLVGMLSVCFSSYLQAELTLPAIISDHMVLQRDAKVPIWGWAEPGENVTVVFGNQVVTAKADEKGAWKVFLDLESGPVSDLVIQGAKEKIMIKDVLIGEVWLGSGQSNMAMTVNRAKDFEAEQKQANLPQIRMFIEKSGPATSPQLKGNGVWTICSAESVGGFSATLYFFGRELHQKLNVPVGLINSSVGGTPIESWIDPKVQEASSDLKPFFEQIRKATPVVDEAAEKARYEKQVENWKKAVADAKAAGKEPPQRPRNPAETRTRKGNVGGLFLGKISPLIPYKIKGALWYQGEANSTSEKAKFYQYQLPLLVTDWRAKWGHDFPFAWAQLPNYQGTGRDWPIVREAMLKSLAVPNTGMGINIDIGETKDIHPKNKQEVGRRLSLWALGSIYHKDVAETSGPLPVSHEVQGQEVIIKFSHAKGLKADGDEIKGFVIAGEDKVWHPAHVKIQGESVIVSSNDVKKPVAVRYLWENDPVCSLRNGAGLPMTPFRTDSWE